MLYVLKSKELNNLGEYVLVEVQNLDQPETHKVTGLHAVTKFGSKGNMVITVLIQIKENKGVS